MEGQTLTELVQAYKVQKIYSHDDLLGLHNRATGQFDWFRYYSIFKGYVIAGQTRKLPAAATVHSVESYPAL